jgi:hypothetical protein
MDKWGSYFMSELIDTGECFFNVAEKSQEDLRKDIFDIERIILDHVGDGDPLADFPVKHYRIGNLYAREAFIPAGHMLVGKIHSGVSISVCSMGDISVMTELGVQRIKAPFTCTAEAGIKRVGYTHSDTIWISIHETDCENIEDLENELTDKSYNAIEK